MDLTSAFFNVFREKLADIVREQGIGDGVWH